MMNILSITLPIGFVLATQNMERVKPVSIDSTLPKYYQFQCAPDLIVLTSPVKFDYKLNNQFLQSIFTELKNNWLSETMFSSNPEEIYKNENYQSIIKMGMDVVPFLVDDLKLNNTDWLMALRAIFGEHPTSEGNEGNFEAMKADWLNWLKLNIDLRYGASR